MKSAILASWSCVRPLSRRARSMSPPLMLLVGTVGGSVATCAALARELALALERAAAAQLKWCPVLRRSSLALIAASRSSRDTAARPPSLALFPPSSTSSAATCSTAAASARPDASVRRRSGTSAEMAAMNDSTLTTSPALSPKGPPAGADTSLETARAPSLQACLASSPLMALAIAPCVAANASAPLSDARLSSTHAMSPSTYWRTSSMPSVPTSRSGWTLRPSERSPGSRHERVTEHASVGSHGPAFVPPEAAAAAAFDAAGRAAMAEPEAALVPPALLPW
mmetsp:Transcript_23458/g.89110  ORF Transcript_23458/g.89110 Transcript_23458/m.89110 type:complete len:283 (-) Transcript_23458:14-862(-)